MNVSTGLTIFGVAAITVAGATATPATRTPIDFTQWITFMSVVAGFVYQAYRENRQRRWDLQDRKAAREAADHKADDLGKAIAENTKISDVLVEKADASVAKTEEMLTKTTEIHTQTNGNLSKVESKLAVANERILGMQKLLDERLPVGSIGDRKGDAPA